VVEVAVLPPPNSLAVVLVALVVVLEALVEATAAPVEVNHLVVTPTA
jgi:hypothetical protein